MERVGRGCQIDRRANGSNRAELGRAFPSPFACKFQDQIAAHGKSSEGEARDVIVRDEMAGDGGDVGRASGMVERGRDAISASAIALIHANHVHSARQTFRGDAQHVSGIAGTFESVDDDHGESVRAIRLPVAMAKDFRSIFDINQSRLTGRRDDMTRKQKAANGLQMSAAQSTARLKCWFVLRGPHGFILNG